MWIISQWSCYKKKTKTMQDSIRTNAIMPSSSVITEAREPHTHTDFHPIRIWTFPNLTFPIISQSSKPFHCDLCNAGSIHVSKFSYVINQFTEISLPCLDLAERWLLPWGPLQQSQVDFFSLPLLPPLDQWLHPMILPPTSLKTSSS